MCETKGNTNNRGALRIGILGGSFDPVHTGHVNLARDALEQANLDRVLVIPARLQPFKLDRMPASGEDRMEMLRLALKDEPRIQPCGYELEQEGVSYTYLTLKAMQEKFGPKARIYFIIGADSLLKLDTWMHAEELLSRYAYIVGSRPGYMDEELDRCRERLHRTYGTEIIWVHNRQFDVSSTELRQRLAEGASTGGLIPAEVETYIREHGLYRAEHDQPLDDNPGKRPGGNLNEQGLDYTREHLKPSRFRHTLMVREEAVRLAKRFGADEARAETAAIFHDMAKNLSGEEMKELIREFQLDEKYIDQPNLAHSKLAACLMKRDFGVTDPDILNAVAYHTTGRAGMTDLEKIVFLADAIEPGRDYPSVDEIRKVAEMDLDGACILLLELTVEYLSQKGTPIDGDTLDALQDMKRKETEKGNIQNG